jgi:hypothetical protein
MSNPETRLREFFFKLTEEGRPILNLVSRYDRSTIIARKLEENSPESEEGKLTTLA